MRDSKPAFTATVIHHLPNGKTTRVIEVFDLTPAEQRDHMLKGLIGYDCHAPDGWGDVKWRVPISKEK